MVEPIVVPRAGHPISRRNIDPDALRVLYRLRDANHVAYLVGGSVRDLLLGRRPKDFDIGTSAHPYQVKRLFRNCWVIGRRFRLVHVRFGTKVVEVATFRRQVPPNGEPAADVAPTGEVPARPGAPVDLFIHRDNTFGTPEEDAFRRDFTINALFYDIATFSIIDYVGGLADLKARLVRSIGDPDERFREDPVRMLRAMALASRLDFAIDPPIYDAIRRHRGEIARSAPARLLEEYYKILRSGAAERTFRSLVEVHLLAPISPELHEGASDRLWASLAALDRYRARFDQIPETLTNAILLGSLLAPLGLSFSRPRPREDGERRSPERPGLGALPLARRDFERLRQILALQHRLCDTGMPPRAANGLMARTAFRDALTWLEIHGNNPDVMQHWRSLMAGEVDPSGASGPIRPRRRRRRRRRRDNMQP
jgi:poly(A) polymerase